MNCRRTRRLLTRPGGTDTSVRRHLATCDECGRFAARLAAVERSLADHHTQVIPSAGFAGRVRARLAQSDDLLGWAALRVLPATLVLIVLLSWLNLQGVDSAEAEILDPTDAVLTWVLDPSSDLGSGS